MCSLINQKLIHSAANTAEFSYEQQFMCSVIPVKSSFIMTTTESPDLTQQTYVKTKEILQHIT